jgi:hypothetical protein
MSQSTISPSPSQPRASSTQGRGRGIRVSTPDTHLKCKRCGCHWYGRRENQRCQNMSNDGLWTCRGKLLPIERFADPDAWVPVNGIFGLHPSVLLPGKPKSPGRRRKDTR